MRKSSKKMFSRTINTLFDNSMGDHNDLVFDFIDDHMLQDEFKEYLTNFLTEHAYDVGYSDGENHIPHNLNYKKLPELFVHYHEGYLAGHRGE